MPLPTRQEICPHDDLDGRVACEHFLGRSLHEAVALFREQPSYYESDLMWMGPVAFRYYVHAAIQFIRGLDAGHVQGEFITGFAGTVRHRLQYEAHELAPVATELAGICGYIVEHWPRFGVDPEFYGDVRARYAALQQAFLRLSAETETVRTA